jgi:glycyl-tRNA synthetase beta chain
MKAEKQYLEIQRVTAPGQKTTVRVEAERLLIEIGTEEIPARFFAEAQDSMAGALKTLLKENYIDYDYSPKGVSIYATPRRLALILKIAVMQRGRTREAFGPPKKVAYNKDGSLSKAGEGFARSQGVKPEDMVVKKKGKGEYVAAIVEEEGKPTVELLPEILKKVVFSIHFRKSMRWGDGDVRFARPIHWIVALYGNKIVKFEIDGIKSGNKTRGHRFLAPGDLKIGNAEQYIDILKKSSVIASQGDRVKLIEDQAKKLAASVKGVPFYIHEYHKRDVANLVEFPQAVLGSFDKKYLELPDELLSSVMWGHQKYFSVVNNYKAKKLKNYFIVISNTKKENADAVRRGAERVIRARFDDARFYYEEDRARTLESRVEDLKKVTFHEKLGSLHDKTVRVKSLASNISEIINPDIKESVERAALLSKTDLITGVVYEFPELQGVMGKYYAEKDEEPEVADALMEQYLPAFSGDQDGQHRRVLLDRPQAHRLRGPFRPQETGPCHNSDPYGERLSSFDKGDV